jgi:hypothetical protein
VAPAFGGGEDHTHFVYSSSSSSALHLQNASQSSVQFYDDNRVRNIGTEPRTSAWIAQQWHDFRYQVSFQTPSTLSTDGFISRSNRYSHLRRNSDVNIGTKLRAAWPTGIRHCVQTDSVVYQHHAADTSPLSPGIQQPEGDAGCSSTCMFVLRFNHNVGTCVLLFPKLPNKNND